MAKGTKRKREETEEEQEEEEEEEEGYQVEVITEARVKDADLADPWEYHVKWAGYDSGDDTWEPAANVAACQRLLDSFWNEVGVDDNDYPEGTVLTASDQWIKKERKRFRIEYAQNKEEERKQKERAERKKEEALATKKQLKKQKKSQKSSVPSRSASTSHVRQNSQSSVSSYPAPPPASAPLPLPKPKKKAKLFVSDSEDSDDDKPLASSDKKKNKKRKLSPGDEDEKQAKVAKTSASASTSSVKFKNFESGNKKSASSSRAASPPPKAKDVESKNKGKQPAPPAKAKDLESKNKKKQPAPASPAPTPSTKAKDTESSNNAKKPAPPPSSRPSPPKNTSSTSKGKNPASRPGTPPAELLFASSPEPEPSSPSSPEVTLMSLKPKSTPKPKPKPAGKSTTSNSATAQPQPRPQISVNTELPTASPTIASGALKPTPLPLPKPQPSTSSAAPLPLPVPRRTGNPNPASASSTGPPRPFATPTLPSATIRQPLPKPATPVIPATNAKPATPTIPPAPVRPAFPARENSSSSSSRAPPPLPNVGLSTKQRLAQGALELAAPTKEPPKKIPLAGMKIKKINRDASGGTGTAAAGGSGSGTARVRTAPPPPRPPPPPEKDPLFDSPGKDPLFDAPEDNEPLNQVESPVDMFGDANEQSILPPALSRRKSAQAAQTDEWLSANGPPQMAAPLAPAVDPPIAARLGVKPKIISHLKPIPKKWKWSGKLFMDVTDPKDAPPRTDHLCNVVLNELFPTTVEGPQINVVMGSREALRLLSFHDLVDMSEFLKTSGVRMSATLPLQQLARLGPAAEADEKPLKTLARYMTKKNFISLVPTYFDGDLVGHLLLFPPVMSVLCRMLKVPPEMLQNSALIVALLPWKPFPQESRRPFGLLAPPTKPRVPSESDWKKNMTKAKYQLGLRILKFPPELHAWFARTSKTYCVWPPSEERRGNRERETVYLMAVLKECGAKKVKVGIKADLRAVFVHVGALGSIHRMPLLVERRSQTCGIRFYTFGTHESVHPEYWGVREVYPLGGVVTFTASALYEDPWGIVDKMKAINKHPLWTCYILPSVFGLATKLCHLEEDPLAAFDRDEFVFDRLLRAIDDGEVSVLRAPPLERNATRSNDPAADWLREHWINRPPGPRQMLESCLSAFSAKYSNTPRAGWASAVEAEVSADLDLMQVQPDIMKQYRRYVVIKAETDSHLAGDKDGFEWLSSSTFSFCDEFLSSPQKTAGVS